MTCNFSLKQTGNEYFTLGVGVHAIELKIKLPILKDL